MILNNNFNKLAGDMTVRLASYFQGQGVGSYLRTNLGVLPVFDHSKATSSTLGLKFRDIDETLDDLVKFLQEGGVIEAKKEKRKEK